MLAQAWLAVNATRSREKDPPAIGKIRSAGGYQPLGDGIPIVEPLKPDQHMMIPFTLNEIRHIFGLLGEIKIPPPAVRWWSTWRRRHQATARHYHYRRHIRAPQTCATLSRDH